MNFKIDLLKNDIATRRGQSSLRTIASDIGVSASTISRINNGKTPEALSLAKICKWLDKPVEAYIEGSRTEKLKEVLTDIVTVIASHNRCSILEADDLRTKINSL